MKFFLSRDAAGFYLLTRMKPLVERRMGDGVPDLYVVPGDPIQVRHLCPKAIKAFFGIELETLDSCRVLLRSSVLEEES